MHFINRYVFFAQASVVSTRPECVAAGLAEVKVHVQAVESTCLILDNHTIAHHSAR
jgi:hypothetical protein